MGDLQQIHRRFIVNGSDGQGKQSKWKAEGHYKERHCYAIILRANDVEMWREANGYEGGDCGLRPMIGRAFRNTQGAFRNAQAFDCSRQSTHQKRDLTRCAGRFQRLGFFGDTLDHLVRVVTLERGTKG